MPGLKSKKALCESMAPFLFYNDLCLLELLMILALNCMIRVMATVNRPAEWMRRDPQKWSTQKCVF